MSGKLNQSLDDIVKSRPRAGGRRLRTRRVGGNTRTTATGPAGGVTKNTKTAKTAKPTGKATGKAVQTIAPPATGESKIVVTGLPGDVSEQQIKEYFTKTIGPVKRVFLSYGPTGQSRGVSTIVFTKPGSANEAASQLNGVKVDNRAMKIEVVVGAPTKGLGDRITKPKTVTKTQAKPATTTTAAAGAIGGRGRRLRRGRNATRPKPKTADELDAEMVDYFDAPGNGAGSGQINGAAVANGTEQPVGAGGDAGMEDEIL